MSNASRADDRASANRPPSPGLAGPPVDARFDAALNELIAVAQKGHEPSSEYFNPSEAWLTQHMRILQDLPAAERQEVLREAVAVEREASEADAAGRAAIRAWPDVAVRLDSGGLAFFSQLGVARRPDLTQYFIDGFERNRDSLALSAENQRLFADVIPLITRTLERHFSARDTVVQTDRRIGDVPSRSFHARQLLVGTHYLQIPYFWRQLTFDLPPADAQLPADILEVSIPRWLEDIDLPSELRARIEQAGLTKLVFKAPTKGLSLHLGFDYVGEHKMGPLSIVMFKAKERRGLAVQAALSVAHVDTIDGSRTNSALITLGPSLHGKSTLTIMLELAGSDLATSLSLKTDPTEGVYPMNDDIILVQPLDPPLEVSRGGRRVTITHAIDGTEDNFYAVPFRLNRDDDPITYDVLRGAPGEPNVKETLENSMVDAASGTPDFTKNPVRNMRMILSRSRLVERRGAESILSAITQGTLKNSVHVPMEYMDRIIWQGVMRQNTVVPPLIRLRREQYVRSLMFGEAVQTGAAVGAIGRPYVEYFSDPFIIGLEDENANNFYQILGDLENGGMAQEYYIFNTGGIGADSNENTSGENYRKIPRELTLMLQEAILRRAVKFERDPFLGSEVAVAIVDRAGNEVLDLREEWSPRRIYGDDDFSRREHDLRRKRYYGDNQADKAGILRYTKVVDAILEPGSIPSPLNEREMAWLVSFYWHLDHAYETLTEAAKRSQNEGQRPAPDALEILKNAYTSAQAEGLTLNRDARAALSALGV